MIKDEFQKAVDDVIADCIRNDYSFGSYAYMVTEAVWPLLEAAEKSDAESIAMYRKARDERDALRAENAALVDDMNLLRNNNTALRSKIEAAENDDAHQKALAASALRVAEGWERKCGELRAEVIYWKEQKEPGAAGWRALARILRAKIEAMEQQEPVATIHINSITGNPSVDFIPGHRYLHHNDKLYLSPGAQGE